MIRRSGKNARRPAWITRIYWQNSNMNRSIKKIEVDRNAETPKVYVDAVRKAKTQQKLNVARGIKVNKKGSATTLLTERRLEKCGPIVESVEALVAQVLEKSEVLTVFSASIFISKTSLEESQGQQTHG